MSAGGLSALRTVIETLPGEMNAPIVVAQHVAEPTLLPHLLRWWTSRDVRCARHGELLRDGSIYICPAQHHIAIKPDATLAVVSRARLPLGRPSIDWLFESAAGSFGDRAIALLLSGSNCDGARGAHVLRTAGGHLLVQDPLTAAYADMPRAALRQDEMGLHPLQIAPEIGRTDEAIRRSYEHGWSEPFVAPYGSV